jgi:hypothetical protein
MAAWIQYTINPFPILPTTGSLAPAYVSSLVVALLLTLVSAIGLLFQSAIYPTEELAQSFVVTDLVNLVIGVPILLGSMGLARQGKLIGLLFWPGALLFAVYHSIAYVYALPLSWIFLLYVLLLVLSVYTMIGLVAGIDGEAVGKRLRSRVPERLAGGVLIGLGVFSLLRNLAVLAGAIPSQAAIPATELGVMISDSILIAAWIIGGVLLWRRQALGYVGGTGLLFQGSMLFIGLIVWMVLTPRMTGAPFVLTDLVVVLIMSLICFVPFALFLRGVTKT